MAQERDAVADPSALAERLTGEDVGLPEGARMPFRFTPATTWSPLVVSFPHVGLAWPHDLLPKPQVDFAKNADYEVHTLYEDAATRGAAMVEAVYSRLTVDLNRAHDDVTRSLVPDHPAPRPRLRPGVVPTDQDLPPFTWMSRGVLWDRAVGDVRVLPRPLRYTEFEQRILRYHAPYYRALEVLLERRRARFGFAILLDAHSMPSSVGIDLVLGTLDGKTCSDSLSQIALDTLSSRETGPAGHSLTVRLNDPFRGGEVIRYFGRPDHGWHALQLEVNRALYMDEQRDRLWPRADASATPPTIESSFAAQRSGAHAKRVQSDFAARASALAELVARVKSLVDALVNASAALDLSPRSAQGARRSET